MTKTVLVFLFKKSRSGQQQILLGIRKTGEGIGQYNGIGGKCEPHESIRAAAVREVQEEINITIKSIDLKHLGHITYQQPVDPCTSDVFTVYQWQGTPQTSKEITPHWFDIDKIPYHQMWPNDQLWLPKVLKGEKFTATIWHDKEGKLLNYEVNNLN